MWWTINRMKMSLHFFRSGAGKCPHTLVPPKAVELSGTLKEGMPWCPIPPSVCRKQVKVSLLSGVNVCWQGPHFSAALTPSTGKPHSCHSSLGYNHSRNSEQTRWHCAAAGLLKSGSPELSYLLCPTGCVITRLARAWLLVLLLHPLSGCAAWQNHVSDRKSKGVSADPEVSALSFVGTHQEQPSSINSSTGATFSFSFNLSLLNFSFPCIHILTIMSMLVDAYGCPVLTLSKSTRGEDFLTFFFLFLFFSSLAI